jgi:cytidylate kinase
MAVITISRQYGSGGDEIASRVCKMLGWRYFDKQLMIEVASEIGLSESEIIDFSEADYEARGFLERLFSRRSARVIVETGIQARDIAGAMSVQVEQLDEEWCIRMVRSAIQAAYKQGDVIIVGRGGQAILQDKPDVLHVRVEAPFETRVSRVRYEEPSGLAPGFELQAAREKVNERDKAAGDYLRRFYNIDWADPKLYHLVIDTKKWGIGPAACLIVQAVTCLPQVG